MSTKFVLIFLILAKYVDSFIDSTFECVDCHKESRGTCEINSDPGFSCGVYKRQFFGRSEAVDDADSAQPTTTADLDVCIPKNVDITSILKNYTVEAEEQVICCFWSKARGCQLLVETDNDLWTCGTCNRGTHKRYYNDLEPCPCINMNDGSGIMYGSLPLVMAVNYVMWL